MLTDLLKPAWKSRSIEKRRSAISEMDCANAEHQDILLQLASDDEDSSIRIAAIRQIPSVAALHGLSLKLSDDLVRTEAEKRVNELLSMAHSLDEEQYHDLLKRYPELQLRIAAHAESSATRTEVINTLSNGQLLEVLSATAYTDSRQLIAEKLSDIEAFESARRILRGKDKNAERTIKAKIDTFNAQERQHAENLTRTEKLIEEIEYLASHDWLPEFKVRCLAHRPRWDNLDFDIDDAARQRYQVSRDIVDIRFEQQRVIEQTLQSLQQLPGQIEALLQIAANRDLTDAIETLPQMLLQQQQFSSDWQTLVGITSPDKATLAQYDKVFSALCAATRFVGKIGELVQGSGDTSILPGKSRQLEAALKNLKWPAGYYQLRVANELQQQLADWRKAQKNAADEHQQKLSLTHKKIGSIFRFARSGNLSRAKQIAQRAQKSISQFSGKDHSALQARFDEAIEALGEMGDWKNFATEPKYLELCEAMDLLANSKHNPDKLSSEIKALQQQWKALGHSDISDRYWPRFKLSADNAYRPCAEFFEQRRETRKTNLATRQQYVDQMKELLETTDWDVNPDYKAAQSSVRSISDGFTRIKEVERNAAQKQWKQFSKFKAAVMTRLEVAYEANIALKQQLIEQTEALAQATAKVENLATLKNLQSRWKQIGITRRNQDQQAWTEFKKQGDIVYNCVQELRQGQRNETDQQLNAYRKIIKDIRKLAETANELTEADQQFSVLQTNYENLTELPRQLPEKLLDGIQRDYRTACEQYDNRHSRIIKSRHEQELDALRRKASLCIRLEASPSEQQLLDISQQWDAIALHNRELSRRIEARRNSLQSTIDRVAIGEERRMLCIRLEIATSMESPDEDKSLRMQYQLEQMNKSGLGQQSVNNKELLENMELDWLCMPGAETELQKALDERFQRTLRSIKN